MSEKPVKRWVTSLTMSEKPVIKKAKTYHFHEEWENDYLVTLLTSDCICLVCKENLAHPDKEGIEAHFKLHEKSFSRNYPSNSDLRKDLVKELKTKLGLLANSENLCEMKDSSSFEKKESITMNNVVPAIGKPAPNFMGTAVVNGEFKEISLSDYEGRYVVLFFYPLDFTFVCPTEIIAFSDRVDEFRNIECEVIACSTDSQFSHLAWINTSRKQGGLGDMNIPLLADKSMEISKAFGVLKEDAGISFRGLFIIDRNQNLRQVTINDLPVGRDVDETLRLVQAFQFTDEHGEVCPAGWKPGSKTMVPDPVGSKDYFASQE